MTDVDKEPGKFVAAVQEMRITFAQPKWAISFGAGAFTAAITLFKTENVALASGWPFVFCVLLGVAGTLLGVFGLLEHHYQRQEALGQLPNLTCDEANVLWAALCGKSPSLIWKPCLATNALVEKGLLKEVASHSGKEYRQFEIPEDVWGQANKDYRTVGMIVANNDSECLDQLLYDEDFHLKSAS